MTVKITLLCVLLLESISGTLGYDYNVGGMVAASLAGFIFLVAIAILLIIAVMWRDWYMKRQARKGRYRIPRVEWRMFKQKVKRSASPEGTPKSGRKMNMRMYNIAPGSRVTTLERQEPITDAWITRLPPVDHYEEKSKTLKFEPEEEHFIIADVLPESTPRSQPTVTYQQDTSFTNNYTTKNDATTTYLRQTTAPTERVSYEPYHVRVQMSQASSKPAQQLSQTTRPAQQLTQTTYSTQQMSQSTRPAHVLSKTVPARPASGHNDIFIQPQIPASNSPVNQAGVVVFDSDDEAGNIPAQPQRQSEDIVLF